MRIHPARCMRVLPINLLIVDTSCILAWLIEQKYEVVAFMADVGQEEVRSATCCALPVQGSNLRS